MKRTAGVAALAALLLLAAPAVAQAAWTAVGIGSGSSAAYAMPSGTTPSVSVVGRNVTVSWGASSFPDTTPVNAYVVRRYDVLTGTFQTIGSGCAGTVAALTCTEAAVPTGQWNYTVTPMQHAWTGIEGPLSSTAAVGTASLTLSPTSLTSLPTTISGSIATFLTGETVVFRLDDPTTGTVLSGSISPTPVDGSGAASATVTIPGGTTIGSHTVYAVGSLGSLAGAAITVSDTTAPTVSLAVIGKTQGGTPGYVKQAGTYYVYASVSDPGDPATGVATVTADVSAVTTGQTAVAMTAGTYSVGGVAYNYRSASLTATNPLPEGSKAFTITARDVAGNATTRSGFSVTVDNTRPSAADVQTANASGGTVGKAETGDTISFTFSEPMDPGSILSGWSGPATPVTIRLVQNGSSDRIQVWNAGNTTQLPFGTTALGRTDYATVNVSFTGSSMLMSGSAITVTLGTPGGAVGTAGGTGTITWTPTTTPYDRATNACLGTARTETGAADAEF